MKKRVRMICALLAVLLLCAACGSVDTPVATEEPVVTEEPLSTETPAVYEYSEPYVRLMEPCGTGFVLQKNVLQTELGGHIYRFAPSIAEDERAAFIQGQEALCALLDGHGISTDALCFFVMPDYSNWTDAKNLTAYYSLETLDTWRQALTTLQVALGDYTNYGYLYALADHAAAELGWERDGAARFDAARIDGTLLNLVYPCFDETYTAPKDIAACKALSKVMISGLDDPWSEEAFLQARQDYAEQNAIDFTPTYLGFAYYSPSCKIKIRTKFLEIFKSNFYEHDLYYTHGYLEEDYMASLGGMIRAFHWLDAYLGQLRALFGVDSEQVIPVYLTDDAGKYADLTYAAYYVTDKDGGSITGMGLPVMAHEYIHYLFWLCGGEDDPKYELWINEVAACYYSLPADYETFKSYINLYPLVKTELNAFLGKPLEGLSDLIRYYRLFFRETEGLKPYKYYLITDYDLRAVFGEYFVRTYGQDVFLEWLLHPSKARQLTGKTTEEIVNDWCADMDDAENDEAVFSVPFGVNYGSER